MALDAVWKELGLNKTADWKRLGGRAGVGVADMSASAIPIWTDKQLGLTDGTYPNRLGRTKVMGQWAGSYVQPSKLFPSASKLLATADSTDENSAAGRL